MELLNWLTSNAMEQFYTVHSLLIGSLLFVILCCVSAAFLFTVKKHKIIKENEDLHTRTMEAALVGLFMIQDHKFVYANQAMLNMFGYDSLAELKKKKPTDLVASTDKKLVEDNIKQRLDGHLLQEPYTIMGQRRNSSLFPVRIFSSPTKYKGKPAIVGTAMDISEPIEYQKQIYNLAFYDNVTRLPNRVFFLEQLEKTVASSSPNTVHGIFIIDIDDFTNLNNLYGQDVGDKLLKVVGKRLFSLTQSLAVGDTDFICARVGNDEFAILLTNITDEQTQEIAPLCIQLFDNNPISIDEHVFHLSISVGESLFPIDGQDADTLYKTANMALNSVKQKGKHMWNLYNSNIQRKLERNISIERIITDLISTQHFTLAFQPIYDLRYQQVCGVEALLRLDDQTYDIEEVIRIAEKTDLIIPLGNIILKKAIQNCSTCAEMDIRLSINISIQQLEDEHFVSFIQQVLEEYNFPPDKLSLEITETIFMEKHERNVEKLCQLAKKGIKISIDDFGKRYSSMMQLKNLPVHKLKIDSEFTQDISHPKSREIIKGMISLGHTLDLVVCVEGVETSKQYEIVKTLGVDQIQGFYFSKPLPASQLINYLKTC